jgi:hypothetical protein
MTVRTLSSLPTLVRVAAAAWVVAATYVFIVEGVLNTPYLWAPYLGIILWTPIWLIGASGLVLLLRGASQHAQRLWSIAATVIGGFIATINIMDLATPELDAVKPAPDIGGILPTVDLLATQEISVGLLAVPLTLLSFAALVTLLRARG